MPPRLNIIGARRSLVVRPKPSTLSHAPLQLRVASRRGFADEKDHKPAAPATPDVLGHVSEEAADLGDVTGETKPDLGQATPVQEILERDEKGKEMAPQVIQSDIEDGKESKDSKDSKDVSNNTVALEQLEEEAAGHKFGLPDLPLPPNRNLHHRYDPVVSQVTNLLMRHGKLGMAQRNMGFILNHLRTAPPPTPNPSRPLLPGSPPASHLPLNPILYLTLAIDSVAPLIRTRYQKGAAGGGQSLQIPVPMGLKQRRRTAVQWILDAARKKPSRGSGRGQFAQRVAEEVISVAEGKSAAWEKRLLIHKTGTSNRANVGYKKLGSRY